MLVYLQAIDDPEDRTRFEAMYSAYRGLMFHAANRILQNPQDAEDAVHLAFLSLANHRLPPELGPQARHLAAVTAERKAIDLYRVCAAQEDGLVSYSARPKDTGVAPPFRPLIPGWAPESFVRDPDNLYFHIDQWHGPQGFGLCRQ